MFKVGMFSHPAAKWLLQARFDFAQLSSRPSAPVSNSSNQWTTLEQIRITKNFEGLLSRNESDYKQLNLARIARTEDVDIVWKIVPVNGPMLYIAHSKVVSVDERADGAHIVVASISDVGFTTGS